MWPDDNPGAGKATHSVDILAFVDAQQIPAGYFDASYQLAPVPGGERLYAMLRETLKSSRKIGIAYVVIETRQQLVALVPQGDSLVLSTLMWEGEPVRRAEQAPVAPQIEPFSMEAAMQITEPDAAIDGELDDDEDWADWCDWSEDGDAPFCADVLATDLPDEEDEAFDRALASVLDLRPHAGGQDASRRRRRTARRPRGGWLRPRSRLLS